MSLFKIRCGISFGNLLNFFIFLLDKLKNQYYRLFALNLVEVAKYLLCINNYNSVKKCPWLRKSKVIKISRKQEKAN